MRLELVLLCQSKGALTEVCARYTLSVEGDCHALGSANEGGGFRVNESIHPVEVIEWMDYHLTAWRQSSEHSVLLPVPFMRRLQDAEPRQRVGHTERSLCHRYNNEI